jgi:EAL domain-containing protein (putative c-di-GMP-specific phosphodiesterase class I)
MLDGLAEDKLDILVDVGITVVLYEFGTTGGDLACLEDLSVRAVKMAKRVISRVPRGVQREILFLRATGDLIVFGAPCLPSEIEERFNGEPGS